jgi:peptidoglycan/LPS O-acetylase OafA/YrhL
MSHAHLTMVRVGFTGPEFPTQFFQRGGASVDFFFTLSGFLITWPLLQERDETGDVSLSKFYLRRACRIWPLYFLILALGFAGFGILYPRVFHAPYFEFPLLKGLVLYLVFLPNAMATFYKVGLLYPLWSIGVEEQFYLFWAPVVKFCRRRLFLAILSFTIVIFVFQLLVDLHRWTPPAGK